MEINIYQLGAGGYETEPVGDGSEFDRKFIEHWCTRPKERHQSLENAERRAEHLRKEYINATSSILLKTIKV